MWRLANFIYRTFLTVGTHGHSQGRVIPLTAAAVVNKDNQTNQFSSQNIEKLQEYLQKISFQVNVIDPSPKIDYCSKELPPPSPSPEQEDTLDSLLQADEAYMSTLQSLIDLNQETMSIINNQLALEAIEAGDTKSGIEILHLSATGSPNAPALYNLGLCYERGLGVEKDRTKVNSFF